MKIKGLRCFFLFLFTLVMSVLLCLSASAEGEEGHDLTVSLSLPDSAAITIKVDDQEIAELATKVQVGATVEVTINPNAGYIFEQWNSTPVLAELVDPSATTVSFIMPDSDVTLSAVMQNEIPQEHAFRIVINDASYGTAAVNGAYWGAITEDKMILAGDTVVLKANPNSGYKFSKWVDNNNVLKDVDLSASEVSFTMPHGDVELLLEFDIVVYYFNVVIQGEGEVTIDGKEKNSAGKYVCTVGEEIAIMASPAELYVFAGWYSNNHAAFVNYEDVSTTLICPASDFTVTANFAPLEKDLTLTASTGGKVMIDLNSGNGPMLPGEDPIRCGVDLSYMLVAVPDKGYVFSRWECSVSGNVVSDAKNANSEFTMPNEDCTIKAVFEKGSYRVLLETTAGGSATVTEGSFKMGTKVELIASPSPGYVFSHWECAVEGVLENPTAAKASAVIPGSNVEIRAVFVLEATFDPSVSVTQNQDTNNNTDKNVKDNNDGSFPWLAILLAFLLSACAIILIIIREKYNLSYRCLVEKFFMKK